MANASEKSTEARIKSLMTVVENLSKVVGEQNAKLASHPREIAELNEKYDVAASRAKRDRELKPEKRGTATQLDVLQASMLALKKAKRAMEDAVVDTPVLDAKGEPVDPPKFERAFAVQRVPEIKEAAESLDEGIRILARREEQLWVVFLAESNRIGYEALEASELCEGGGGLQHLDAGRRKMVEKVVAEAKALAKEEKLRDAREAKVAKGKGGKGGRGWWEGFSQGYGPPPPPPEPPARGSASTGQPASLGWQPAEPARPGSAGRAPFGSSQCYKCQQWGHFARECTNAPVEARGGWGRRQPPVEAPGGWGRN